MLNLLVGFKKLIYLKRKIELRTATCVTTGKVSEVVVRFNPKWSLMKGKKSSPVSTLSLRVVTCGRRLDSEVEKHILADILCEIDHKVALFFQALSLDIIKTIRSDQTSK